MQLQVSLLLTVLAVAALAHSSPESDRNELRREQESIACDLRDDTLKQQFKAAVRRRYGAVDPNSGHSTYIKYLGEYIPNLPVRCRDGCDNSCSRVNGVTWCLNLYHPSEDIEMCLNLTSGEINGTDYAWRLGLNEFLEQQTTSPQDSNLQVNNPLLVLMDSLLTFNVRSPDCNATTFHDVQIIKKSEDARAPIVKIHGSNELILGQRNTLLCTVEFYDEETEGRPQEAFGAWYINGSTFDVGYLDSDCNPLEDTDLSCYENTNRIDFISAEYIYSTCPRRIYLQNNWMVIENATEEDAMLTYECRAGFESTNPIPHFLNTTVAHSFVPVYPSIDIVTLETPELPPGHAAAPTDSVPTFFLDRDEHLLWSCSVLAGVEDRLVWTLNGVELPTFLDAKENVSCALSSRDVFAVSHEVVDLGDYERQLNSTLIICGATDFTTGLYECVVNHTKDNDFNITRVWSANVVQSPPDLRLIKIGVSVGCSLVLLVLILAAALLLCYVRSKQQKQKQQQREKDWTLFVTEDILHMKCTSPVLKSTANSLAFHTVDPLEFPRNKLVFLNTVLGKGTFGVVLQARAEDIVKSAPQRNIVAVKTPRSKAPPHEIDNFWEELQLMKHILPHNNVVNLLGYCTTPGGPVYMIIEYARYGSLKDFLRECEQIVLQLNHLPHVLCKSHQCSTSYSSSSASSAYPQLVDKMQLCAQNSVFTPDSTSTPTTASQGETFQFPPAKPWGMTRERLTTQDSGFYGETGDISPQEALNDSQCSVATVAHTIAPLTHDYVNNKGLLYMEDIQNFALQIACGLKHLEESQIVHCDLAARNILIAEGFVLKIGDFGMARDVSEKEYYRKQGGRIPVKWTAPEALQDQIFTYKSDIWSFGVVLWEILTYGQQPYPKLKVRHSWERFIKYLMEGNRLPQPKGCPDNFYELMQSCWHSSPDQRPSAEDLVQFLSQKNLLPISDTGLDSTTEHSPGPDKALDTTESSVSPQCHV